MERGRSANKSPAAGATKRASADGTPAKTKAKRTPSKSRKSPSTPVSSSPPRSRKTVTGDVTATAVLFWYPNMIGYIRVLCMALSFYYARTDWKATVGFYLAAFVGDVVDGYVARHFDQCKLLP